MKKENTKIIELIPNDVISNVNQKQTQYMSVVDFVIRDKKVKVSKVKSCKHAILTVGKNSVCGVKFNYGIFASDETGEHIRLYQKGLLKDREVGFLKVRRAKNGSPENPI